MNDREMTQLQTTGEVILDTIPEILNLGEIVEGVERLGIDINTVCLYPRTGTRIVLDVLMKEGR